MADQPAPEPVVQPAGAPAPDPEAARLRTELEAAAAREAELKQQWAAERQQVVEYIRNQQATVQATAATSEPEDEDSIITRKELKKALEGATTHASRAVGESQIAWARNQRALNRQIAARDLPDFDKFAGQVDNLLDRVDPLQAASPSAYSEVYEVIYGKHLIAERKRLEAEKAAKKAAGAEAEPEPLEAETESASDFPGSEPPAARPRPAPMGDGSGVRTVTAPSSSRARPPKLSRDEEYAVRRYFAGNADTYRTYKGGDIPDEDFDFLGAKGRTKF